MTAEFERATAVRPTSGTLPLAAGASATFAAEIAAGWGVAGMTNGGYLLALAGRALLAATERSLITVNAHFLHPAPPGRCTIEVTALRVGRRMSTVRALARAGETPVLAVVATLEDQQAAPPGTSTLATVAPPPLPIEQCVARTPFDPAGDDPDPGFVGRVDLRVRPADLGFTTGTPTGTPEVMGWFAFPDQQPDDVLDQCALLFAADAFFPPIFNLGGDFAWVPTVELTVHLRGRPAAGPLQAHFHNDVVAGGMLNEDGVLWDVDGVVVAQSRQLALLPRPRR